jgi:arylsulfatase A-like enzyme
MSIVSQIAAYILILMAFSCVSRKTEQKPSEGPALPNIVLIYTDDLGYGDLHVYGGEVPTPNIDQMAKEGLLFSNAYATSATCTPSRYSLLTGEYAWRQKGRGVAPGNASSLIMPGTTTLPGVLQNAGYKTSVIGKWHLGLGEGNGPDWNGKISPGPLEIGFDYSFLIPATGDRVPCVFVENHHVVGLDTNDPIEVNYRRKVGDWPTGKENPELLKMMYSHGHDKTIVNGISRIGYMRGGEAALWRDEDFADILVEKSTAFIEKHQDNPFFLYFSTHDIHVPRVPHERFAGASGKGPRGDVIVQLDWTVGELMKILDRLNLADNTLIVFTSDNGPVTDDGYEDQADELLGSHNPSAGLRGGKYSAFQAGTRVPLIIKWPGKIKADSRSEALISQVDFLRSFAGLAGIEVPENKAPDSFDHLQALLGEDKKGRENLVQEAIQGVLSYVEGDYKYIAPGNGPANVPFGPDIETGFNKEEQLYNLKEDPYEKNNIASENPELVERMKVELNRLVESGNSRKILAGSPE